jgi:hypothetical protein
MSQVTWAGLVLDQQVAGLLVVPDLHAASDRRWKILGFSTFKIELC